MKKNSERIGRRVAVNGKVLSSDTPIDSQTAVAVLIASHAIEHNVSIETATEAINEILRAERDNANTNQKHPGKVP